MWQWSSPRILHPSDFSFRFVKKFWDLLNEDIYNFVNEFFDTGFILNGCNSSFITFLTKISNPTFVKDYRPISLIGVQYKIIAKLLANH